MGSDSLVAEGYERLTAFTLRHLSRTPSVCLLQFVIVMKMIKNAFCFSEIILSLQCCSSPRKFHICGVAYEVWSGRGGLERSLRCWRMEDGSVPLGDRRCCAFPQAPLRASGRRTPEMAEAKLEANFHLRISLVFLFK